MSARGQGEKGAHPGPHAAGRRVGQKVDGPEEVRNGPATDGDGAARRNEHICTQKEI